MLNPRLFRSACFPSAIALASLLTFAQSAPSYAQEEAPAEGEAIAMTPEEKQAKAIENFKEGDVLLKAGSYEEAIAKFEVAFELFPDPGLLVKIGEAYQRDGSQDPANYEKLGKAVKTYQRFVELVPEGETTNAINERIQQLEESINAEEERKQRVANEEEQAKLDEKKALEEAENEKIRLAAEKKEMQVILKGGLMAGADLQASGIIRLAGGALLSWEHFGLEANLGVDGFLRGDDSQGTQARSFTLLDLGARWGMNYRYVGPFVSAGGSFGLFTGRPRERKLKNDSASCGGGDCAFDVDQNISARLGFGYGFKATDKSTVALRLDLQGWFYSVDDAQGAGNPPASQIDKPQNSIAIMVGLEFLRWL